MLSPDQGGMIPPGQHPGSEVTLEDYKRGLNAMVDTCARTMNDDDILMAIENGVAMRDIGFDADNVMMMLAWALVRLGRIRVALNEYDQMLNDRVHGLIAANRFIDGVQRAMEP